MRAKGSEARAKQEGSSYRENHKIHPFLFRIETQMMTAFIQKTIEVWQPDTCRESTEKDRPVEV